MTPPPACDVVGEDKDRHNETRLGMGGSGLPHRAGKAGKESSAAKPGSESNIDAATDLELPRGIPDLKAHVDSPRPAAANEAGSGARAPVYEEGWTIVKHPADSDSHSSDLVDEAKDSSLKPAAYQQAAPSPAPAGSILSNSPEQSTEGGQKDVLADATAAAGDQQNTCIALISSLSPATNFFKASRGTPDSNAHVDDEPTAASAATEVRSEADSSDAPSEPVAIPWAGACLGSSSGSSHSSSGSLVLVSVMADETCTVVSPPPEPPLDLQDLDLEEIGSSSPLLSPRQVPNHAGMNH